MQVSPSLLPPIHTFIPAKGPDRTLPAIKAWPVSDRPREKLRHSGARYMSNTELLAMLLRSGDDKRSALDLARDILFSVDNNLAELSKLTVHQLQAFEGIGPAKASAIVAAMELSRRKLQTLPAEKPVVSCSEDIAALLRPVLQDQCHESFYVIFLNNANRVLHYRCLSDGGITSTTVDPRIVFQEALYVKATRLAVAHNHPSGTLKASRADLQVTKKLREIGKLLDIDLVDHVILSDSGYFSFRDDGLLE